MPTKLEIQAKLLAAHGKLVESDNLINEAWYMVERLDITEPTPTPQPDPVSRDIQPVDQYQKAYPTFVENADYQIVKLHKLPGNENNMMSILFLKVLNADGSPKNDVILHVGAPGWDGADTQSGWKDAGTVEFPITTDGKYNVVVTGEWVSGQVVSKVSDIVQNLDNTIDGPSDDEGIAQRHHSWELVFQSVR